MSAEGKKAARVFAALGDTTRLQLVRRLSREGPQSIARLGRDARISRQAITKHLRALADAGVLRDRRRGRERVWQVEPRSLGDAQRWLAEISQRWDEALDRLRAFVED